MTTQKQEFSAGDAAPVVLYAKTDADDKFAYPVTQAMLNPGLSIPAYDYISLSYTSGNLTGAIFKLGGSGGTTVATLTLAYSSGNLAEVTRT
jgi:hypothetical protein